MLDATSLGLLRPYGSGNWISINSTLGLSKRGSLVEKWKVIYPNDEIHISIICHRLHIKSNCGHCVNGSEILETADS